MIFDSYIGFLDEYSIAPSDHWLSFNNCF